MKGRQQTEIADAQKKRWAKFRAKHRTAAATAKKATPKRKLSPERKAALLAVLAKARAAKAAKKATA